MPKIAVAEGLAVACAVDDYLWRWQRPIPILMMHGFARNARFWHRWVPAIAESANSVPSWSSKSSRTLRLSGVSRQLAASS